MIDFQFLDRQSPQLTVLNTISFDNDTRKHSTMALVRVSGLIEVPGVILVERDIIINPSHIMFATPDETGGTNFSMVHLVNVKTNR